MLDRRSFGGQAGASARIKNYLGFPTGISGMALMARAYNQAQKFGVQLAIPDEAISLSAESVANEDRFLLRLANGEQAVARSVVIASGARYRRLVLPHMDEIEASSIHYWASPLEGKLCAGQEIALVGAGNSAGQAVVYLAGQFAKVSGRDGRVRYIGRTRGRSGDRFKQHKTCTSPGLERWLHEEWSAGYPVESAVIQGCKAEISSEREQYWMGCFPDLVNERVSAETRFNAICKEPQQLRAITNYMRRFFCNVEGFCGIRYDRHWNCYQVLWYPRGPVLYRRDRVEWLRGERISGLPGNTYFSDLTVAVAARDRAHATRASLNASRGF